MQVAEIDCKISNNMLRRSISLRSSPLPGHRNVRDLQRKHREGHRQVSTRRRWSRRCRAGGARENRAACQGRAGYAAHQGDGPRPRHERFGADRNGLKVASILRCRRCKIAACLLNPLPAASTRPATLPPPPPNSRACARCTSAPPGCRARCAWPSPTTSNSNTSR